MIKFDVIIIGAGAAGLMCAITSAKRNRKVLVLEKSEKAGKKILISGGGRCNFTNINTSYENFISSNPHFVKSPLSKFTQFDFIKLVEKHRIAYYEKTLGQLFCKGSSKEIVNMLLEECKENNVTLAYNVNSIEIAQKENFILNIKTDSIECESLVIASGGASIPKMGATEFGYTFAKNTGHKIIEYKPALVPIVMEEEHNNKYSTLSGISFYCEAACKGISFKENLLFTHKGFSGPAILQISSYWNMGESIIINSLTEKNIKTFLQEEKNRNKIVSNVLKEFLPDRFIKAHLPEELNIAVKQLSNKSLNRIENLFHKWEIFPAGTEGFAKAEVTKGGVDVNQLSSKTMESKLVKGLYFIGEVVDVTGWLGGYNFQWAWSSGFAAGEYV